jgi:DNA-binding phage protein
MGGIAKKAGLNRESLYKALGETGNPEFGTVMRIVRALPDQVESESALVVLYLSHFLTESRCPPFRKML